MASNSKEKKTIQAILSKCGGQKEKLRNLAREIVSEISGIDPSGNEGLLDLFISELVLSAADQRRQTERRRHQMECIAAAKARGVQFGPSQKPLPENFDEYHQKWRSGEISIREAAQACGMPKSSFYGAAVRKEQADICAVG